MLRILILWLVIIKEKLTLDDASLLFIVSGIYGGASMPDLLEFIENMDAPPLKRVAIATSCASGKQRQEAVRGFFLAKGIEVTDEFVCKGAFLFVSTSHPSAKDLKEAGEYALKIAGEDRRIP